MTTTEAQNMTNMTKGKELTNMEKAILVTELAERLGHNINNMNIQNMANMKRDVEKAIMDNLERYVYEENEDNREDIQCEIVEIEEKEINEVQEVNKVQEEKQTKISLKVIETVKRGIRYGDKPHEIFNNYDEPNNQELKIFIHKKYVQLMKEENYTKIEDVKKEDFLRRKEGAKKTYIKGKYCRINKAWECQNYEDISDFIYIRKGTKVFTEFDY